MLTIIMLFVIFFSYCYETREEAKELVYEQLLEDYEKYAQETKEEKEEVTNYAA